MKLDENFEKAYMEYLTEEEEKNNSDDLDALFDELNEAQNIVSQTFGLLEEFYSLNEYERGDAPVGTTITGNFYDPNSIKVSIPTENRSDEDDKKEKQKPVPNIDTITKDDLSNQSREIIQNVSAIFGDKLANYSPSVTKIFTSVKDLNGPEKIVVFIKSIVKWIVNLVIYFIEKIKNVLKRLIGAPTRELDPNFIKLELGKSKKVETYATTVNMKNNGPVKLWRFNDAD